MEVGVLGPFEVQVSGEPVSIPGTKMRGLLGVLALDVGATVTPHRLIDAVWGEEEVRSPNVLQVMVSKLRRALATAGEPDCIATRPAGYQLRLDRDDVDALRFEALADRARELRQDPKTTVEVLRPALALWRGAPLSDAPDSEFFNTARARLEELHRAAVEDVAEADLALGRHAHLVPELEAMVAAEPLRERRWALLMRALYASERQADALRAFQRARDVLIEEIGVEPGAELRHLEAAVLAGDASRLGLPAPALTAHAPIGQGFRRRGNMRHPVAACIGRTGELDALTTMVDQHRLVTLTGPGGVGKTRLAIELSAAIRDRVADGVWWVDLATARDGVDALLVLQRSLGMDYTGVADLQPMLDAVAVVLADQTSVLVLDNCEHLLPSLTSIVDELLARCGELRVVATSRERLGIPAEAPFEVEPLELAAAVALFEARVSGTVDDETEAIAAICDRLDRLPLALELAAARTRYMAPSEILERLTNRFDVLRDGHRGAPAHQRNLHAVADWSYELLDEPERIVFERLSVFADGATLDAARHVCAAHGVDSFDVESLLYRLIDKSLVVADRSGVVTRFRMLQTLADYARERLDARGDRDAGLRAHATWVRGLAGTVGWGARTEGETVAAVQDEDTAIRDAIAWSLAAEPLLALEICDELAPFWFGTMRVSSGWELLMAALDAAGTGDGRRRASALAWALVFATMVQDVDTASRLTDEALEFERAVDEPARLGRLCFCAALAAGYRSDGDARRWVEEARRHLAAADTPVALGHVSFADGAVRLVGGDLEAAAASLRDAIEIFRREHDHLGLILAVSRLGELAWRREDRTLFADMHAELLALGLAARSPGVVTGATARLALARLMQGEVDQAQAMARAALASSGESFMPVVNGYVFRTAALVDLHAGHIVEGRRELHDAIEAFEQGTGALGIGQAALCWIDLSRSYLETGETDDARHAAETAVSRAEASGDPWVLEQAERYLAAR